MGCGKSRNRCNQVCGQSMNYHVIAPPQPMCAPCGPPPCGPPPCGPLPCGPPQCGPPPCGPYGAPGFGYGGPAGGFGGLGPILGSVIGSAPCGPPRGC